MKRDLIYHERKIKGKGKYYRKMGENAKMMTSLIL